MIPLRFVYIGLAGIVATLLLWEAWGSVPCVEAPPAGPCRHSNLNERTAP